MPSANPPRPLTAEQVHAIDVQFHGLSCPEVVDTESCDRVSALCDSHEALRAALAEAVERIEGFEDAVHESLPDVTADSDGNLESNEICRIESVGLLFAEMERERDRLRERAENWMADSARWRAMAEALAESLEDIAEDCPFCDHGVLRKRVDGRTPEHSDDCPWSIRATRLAAFNAALAATAPEATAEGTEGISERSEP